MQAVLPWYTKSKTTLSFESGGLRSDRKREEVQASSSIYDDYQWNGHASERFLVRSVGEEKFNGGFLRSRAATCRSINGLASVVTPRRERALNVGL